MRKIVIAMADITQGEMHLMQHRNHSPEKPAAGLIGCFGGQLEEGETSLQALVRELGEETTLITQEADFKKIGAFSVVMSHNDEQLEISGECFQIDVSVGNNIKAKEGDIVKIHKTALFDRISEMSPATATAIEQYYVERK